MNGPPPSECRRLCLALALGLVACGGRTEEQARKAEITSVMARADEPLLRARPRLCEGKYARMAASAYDFYRGTVPLSLHDYRGNNFGFGASAFALAGPLVPALGDPHPENFGALLAADGTLALEPNDFDSADFAPYLWDVRRLVAGMALAARLANAEDPAVQAATAAASREIARAAAEGYAEAIAALAKGAPRERITEGGGDPNLDDLFERSIEDRDARAELDELSLLEGPERRLRRGVLDPEEPTGVYLDVPPTAYAELPAAIEQYRKTLVDPPPPAFFTLLDAARELGSGVASFTRVRVILLVRGPTDDPGDDVVLELKELADSGLAGLYPPGVFYDGVAERVRRASRAAWARPDAEPLWGTTEWMGFVCQIKRESEGQKTLRTSRMVEERGSPAALASLGRRLGGVVARAHAADPLGTSWAVGDVAEVIGRDPAGFVAEQVEVGDRYAAQVLVDWGLFREALMERGPRLGIPMDPADTPPPDLRALYGDAHVP
ncbi:DUF2252 family protein [Polyangium jinanense]|uniref:DUF2252 family protein n=1 Tax=Polyangium jinanense TaxID=2829994 RepID=A0A9X3X3W0_9BACT|nr:DUF2252 family protein [Polyangium jinanense]MDC3959904.1 DUF2252 family protein [Polyangium jinanense]MDC3983784.1 DUF2252 family protein [Polyangium jinanense]